MSLLDSILSNSIGFVGPDLSVGVTVAGGGVDYLACDFSVGMRRSAAGTVFRNVLAHAFGDAFFVKKYLRLLNMSSGAFQGVTDASLSRGGRATISSNTPRCRAR